MMLLTEGVLGPHKAGWSPQCVRFGSSHCTLEHDFTRYCALAAIIFTSSSEYFADLWTATLKNDSMCLFTVNILKRTLELTIS